MRRAPVIATVGRLVCYALVAAAYVLLLAALSGCGILTDAMMAAGIPVGPSANEAARQVDAAISGWIDALLWGAAGAASSETTRAAHRTIKKRRAKKEAAQPTH